MGFSLETSVPVLMVFLQGLPSLFSPCVLLLMPLYVGYLMGGARGVDGDGNIRYPRGRVLVNTLLSVVGISFTLFLLGFGFTALGGFFRSSQIWFARISGIIMILLGLYQFGVFGHSGALEWGHRLSFRLDRQAMSPLVVLVLGLTFSFAWTPCVDPMLGSALLVASSTGSAARGLLLIAVYTLGSMIPFLAVGLFVGVVLGSLERHQKMVRYAVKVSAILLVLMGIMILTGFMNGITSYLPNTVDNGAAETPQVQTSGISDPTPEGSVSAGPEEGLTASERSVIPVSDSTLMDQYGEKHILSDHEGKTVFLNFWATWCGPCKHEMSEMQALYGKYGNNEGDVVVLGVANPKSEEYPYNRNVIQPEVEQSLEDGGYTFPVVMNVIGKVLYLCGISAFPTTFMIGADRNVFGCMPGALADDMMEPTIRQTIDGIETGA